MKKFILKFPTSKRSKLLGELMLSTGRLTIELADRFYKDENGIYTKEGILMLQDASSLMNQGARKCGFRNLAEMHEYLEAHKEEKQ